MSPAFWITFILEEIGVIAAFVAVTWERQAMDVFQRFRRWPGAVGRFAATALGLIVGTFWVLTRKLPQLPLHAPARWTRFWQRVADEDFAKRRRFYG